MPWGFAIGAVGAVAAASIGAESSEDAANTQAASKDASTAEQRAAREQARADSAPYRETGYKALDRLSVLLGLTPGSGSGSLTQPFTGANLTSDPGYQFGLKQGQETLQNSLAARGGLYSGAAGKALTRYGQDYAGTKFNEAFNRDLQTKQLTGNQLAGVSGTGQTSVGQINALGANTANQIGANAIGSGDAQAAAQLARGSAYGNAFNQVAGTGINYLRQQQQPANNYQYYAQSGDSGFIDPINYGINYG